MYWVGPASRFDSRFAHNASCAFIKVDNLKDVEVVFAAIRIFCHFGVERCHRIRVVLEMPNLIGSSKLISRVSSGPISSPSFRFFSNFPLVPCLYDMSGEWLRSKSTDFAPRRQRLFFALRSAAVAISASKQSVLRTAVGNHFVCENFVEVVLSSLGNLFTIFFSCSLVLQGRHFSNVVSAGGLKWSLLCFCEKYALQS